MGRFLFDFSFFLYLNAFGSNYEWRISIIEIILSRSFWDNSFRQIQCSHHLVFSQARCNYSEPAIPHFIENVPAYFQSTSVSIVAFWTLLLKLVVDNSISSSRRSAYMPCGIVRFQDSRLSVFTISESMFLQLLRTCKQLIKKPRSISSVQNIIAT